MQVASRQLDAAQVELSRHANRHRCLPGIENIKLRVRNRATDRNSLHATALGDKSHQLTSTAASVGPYRL